MGLAALTPFGVLPRVGIFAFWGLFLPLGAIYAVRFTTMLNLNVDPPPYTEAYRAMTAYAEAFPLQSNAMESSYIVLLEMVDGGPVVDSSSPLCKQWILQESWLCPLRPTAAAFSRGFEAWLRNTSNVQPGWVNMSTFMSYEFCHEANYTLLQGQLLSDQVHPSDSKATLLIFQAPYVNGAQKVSADFSDAVVAEVRRLASIPTDFPDLRLSARVSGFPVFVQAAQDSVKVDIEVMDSVWDRGAPLALAVAHARSSPVGVAHPAHREYTHSHTCSNPLAGTLYIYQRACTQSTPPTYSERSPSSWDSSPSPPGVSARSSAARAQPARRTRGRGRRGAQDRGTRSR
jgi:hypothetical protein